MWGGSASVDGMMVAIFFILFVVAGARGRGRTRGRECEIVKK